MYSLDLAGQIKNDLGLLQYGGKRVTETLESVKGYILIVDDNPGNLKLLTKILTENGFRTRASDSGKHALKSIKQDPPELILFDVKMPEIDGYEVCRQLKANPLSANIPVIFIRALKDEENKVKCFEMGGVDYITKPFQSEEILARVRTHVSMGRMQHHLEEIVHERTSKLQTERKRFQKLFELASDGFFIHDFDGTIIDVNRQACKSLGYTREEVLHLKVSEIETGVSHEQIIDLCNRADKGQHIIIEGQHRRKDGSVFPVEISLGLFQEQEPKLILAIARNITERKKAEEKLRQYGYVISCSADMMAFMDRRFIYIAANQAYLAAFNISREDLIGHTTSEVIGKDFFKKVVKKNAEYCLAGNVVNYQEWVEFPAYEKRYMDITYSSYTDESNKIKGFVVNARNITEHKKMEESLRKSEKNFRSIFENNSISIVSTDDNYRLLFVNPAFCKLLGYSAEELRQLGMPDITLPEDAERSIELIGKMKRREIEQFTTEKRYRRKDGIIVFAKVSVRAIYDEAGKYLQSVATIEDITEKRKMEEAILQSEKLKSLGTITAGIAHDFNNILAIISGKVQLLEMDYKSNKELSDQLSIIMRAIDDGTEISHRMLKFTKTKKNTTGFVSYDIKDLLIDSLNFTMPRWKSMAQAKGINYHIDKENIKDVPAVLCNPTEVREVFINIINNALDAMPEGGSISFSTWKGDDTAFAEITDTGEGMSEDVKKRVFDPYFTTKEAEGTGLGMSMAYGIITSHGGEIEVESKVGKGSTFKLQFPITTKKVCAIVTPEPEQETKNKSLRIMVVDDEVAICYILDKVLSRYGHRVKTIDNGADAIELTKTESFDLVLCDLAMPEVSGYDVIEVLNRLEKSPKIGIITGWGEKLKPLEERLKVDFIVKKPFKFSALKRQIKETFEV